MKKISPSFLCIENMHCYNYEKKRKVKLHKNSKKNFFYSDLLSTQCMIAEYVSVSFQVFIFIRGGRKNQYSIVSQSMQGHQISISY